MRINLILLIITACVCGAAFVSSDIGGGGSEDGSFLSNDQRFDDYGKYDFNPARLEESVSKNPYNVNNPPGTPKVETLYYPLTTLDALDLTRFRKESKTDVDDYEVKLNYTVHYPGKEKPRIRRQPALGYDDTTGERNDLRVGYMEQREETLCAGGTCPAGLVFSYLLNNSPNEGTPRRVKYEGDMVYLETIGFYDEEQDDYVRGFESKPMLYNSFPEFRDYTIKKKDGVGVPLGYKHTYVHTAINCPPNTFHDSYEVVDDGVKVTCGVDHDERDTNPPFSFSENKKGFFSNDFKDKEEWNNIKSEGDGSAGHKDPGYFYAEAEQNGDGKTTKDVVWKKELEEPITIDGKVYVEGGVQKDYEEESDSVSCGRILSDSASAQGSVNPLLEIFLNKNGGWEKVASDSEKKNGWYNLNEKADVDEIEINAIKVRMKVEAQGDADSAVCGDAEAGASASMKLTNLFLKTDKDLPTIEWDAKESQCEALGGDWLDESTEGLGTDAENFNYGDDYGPARCCGDDWIWRYNLPVKYDSNKKLSDAMGMSMGDEPMCLYQPYAYSLENVKGFKAQELDGEGDYRCSDTGFQAYDPALWVAEEFRKDTDSLVAHPDDLFYLAGIKKPSKRTDIGKWTPWESSSQEFLREEAMVCYHQFDKETEYGEDFKWMTPEKAGNQNQLVCDAYLGENWTGSQCCMKNKTYNDEGKSCDAGEKVQILVNEINRPFSSPEFEEEFMQQCGMSLDNNLACFEGEGVNNNTATRSSAGKRDVFSTEGELYFCNRSSGDQMKTEFEHVRKCGLKGPEKYPYVCAYKNDSWYSTFEASDRLGWVEDANNSNRAAIKEGLHVSSLPVNADNIDNLDNDIQKKECCYFNSCWNGTECVNNFYQVKDNKWSRMYGGIDKEKTNYMCHEGEWLEREPIFNWYYDTDRPTMCHAAYSCACSGEELEEYPASCGVENVEPNSRALDCTKEKHFFKKDHYCEPVYKNGDIDKSRWTSRTKLVALQLLKLAENSENYTLYCDSKEDAVNAPEKLSSNAMPYKINNVCAIEFDGKTAMGFSFNPDNLANPMDRFLFGGNEQDSGFMRVVENNVQETGCGTSASESDPGRGIYRKCRADNPRVWVNHKMSSVIYSKEGLGGQGEKLELPDQSNFNKQNEEFTKVIENSEEKNLPEAAHLLTTASNFNRLYKLNRDGKKAFGFVETRVPPAIKGSASKDPRRNFVGVKYSGFNDVCNKTGFVNKANNYDAHLFCNKKDGNYYVFARSVNEPAYWKNLAPKIRVI